MQRRVNQLLLITCCAVLAPGCGGHGKTLSDGPWYGKVVAVTPQRRTMTFVPACRLGDGKHWTAVPNPEPVSVALSPRADLEIYYRPSGSIAAGHGQSVGLKEFAGVAEHGTLPDFPPGWFIGIKDRAAVSVEEDSGLSSSGAADRKTFACVWSASTRRFIRPSGHNGVGVRVAPDPPLLVPWNRVGDISLGEPRARVERDYGSPGRGFHVVARITHGLQDYYVRHDGQIAVTFEDGRVEEIGFGLPYYRAKSGFGASSRIPLGPCVRTWTHRCGHRWHGFVWNEYRREVQCGCWLKIGTGKRSLRPTSGNYVGRWSFIYVLRGRVTGFRFATKFVD